MLRRWGSSIQFHELFHVSYVGKMSCGVNFSVGDLFENNVLKVESIVLMQHRCGVIYRHSQGNNWWAYI